MSKRTWVILLLCLMFRGVAGLWSQSAATGTSLYFPRFVSSLGADSGIAIFNPNLDDASVTLALTASDGTAIGNPVKIVVPGLSQVARTGDQWFGTGATLDAALLVTSPTPGLVAYYQSFADNNTSMDGAEAAEAGLNLIFPVIPGAAPDRTEIVLLNANPRNTQATLRLWKTDGTMLAESVVQMVKQGRYRGSLATLFPSVSGFSAASHVTAAAKSASLFQAPQVISGTSIFTGLSPLAGSTDIAALNALPITSTFNAGAIPYFRTGSQYFSIVSIANVESASTDVTVTAIGNDGSTLGSRKITLAGNGGFRQAVNSAIPGLGSGEATGWLLFQATGRITAAIVHGRSDAGALSAIPLQKTPRYQFVFPQAVLGSGYYTELSLASPGPYTAWVDIYAVDSAGNSVASNQVILPPAKRVSQRLDQFLPELKALAQGIIFVRSIEPLFATASIWTDSGAVAASFTPQAVSFSYAPAPLQTFAVTGMVTLNNGPARQFPLVLSGPAGIVTTVTKDDGSYIFAGLPAGKYTLTVDEPGFQFVPSQVAFELRTASRRQNFETFLGPNEIVVESAAIPVNSPDTTVRVFGTNLNTTSQAYIGVVRLKTTYVDSSTLKVVIPSFMLAAPAQLDLFVITNDGTPSRRVSDSYPIWVFQDKPALTGLKTNGLMLEGRAATTITLSGSGFLPGATVTINGLSAGIVVVSLSDSTIVAYIPASYFQKAGIYPVTVINHSPADAESNRQFLTVLHVDPDTFLNPSAVHAGSADTTIEIYGHGFNETSEAWVGLVKLETTDVDESMVQAVIPAYMMLAAGEIKINVVTNDSTPSRLVSGTYTLIVYLDKPVLSGIATDGNLMEGRAGAILTLSGSGFLPGATVKIKGLSDGIQIRSVSSNQIVIFVPPSYLADGGIFPVAVVNPYPEHAESNILLLPVYFPTPAIEILLPQLITARLEDSSMPLELSVFGYGFRRGAVVVFEDQPLPTGYCEVNAACLAEHLISSVDPRLLREAGFKKISVKNPDPSLAPSQIAFLRVENPQPTITSIVPGYATLLNLPHPDPDYRPYDYGLALVINGTNFSPNFEIRIYRVNPPPSIIPIFWDPSLHEELQPFEYISSTQVYVTIRVTYPASLGDWAVEILNLQPGGGVTQPAIFTITEGLFAANPFLITLSPSTVGAGGPDFVLTVNGTGFARGSEINFYSTPLATTFVSNTRLTAIVPASLIRTAGKKPVSVTNPDNGGTSNRLFVEVQ